ncbi:MAG: SIMPL domain-containing protein [Acidobacteriota bacterium]|nr:SIMPL domain-containing protein [Acidobacteriota bacterium]
MKKDLSLAFCLLLSLVSTAFAQEAGNRIYGNRGGDTDKPVQRRMPNLPKTIGDMVSVDAANQTITHYQFIDVKVLTTVEAREYTAVFGLAQEAPTVPEANRKLEKQINDFRLGLSNLGISAADTYVDFITQNRVYDFAVKGNTAREKVSGFQIKENFIVRYRDRRLLEKIVALAAQNEIFDLVKVDYVVGDLTPVKAQMMNEAVRIIKNRESDFGKIGIKLTPISVSAEQFDVFQPFEAYNSYKAFEAGEVDNVYRTVEKRKNSTFYFEPLPEGAFDAVLKPIGTSPEVQCTYYLRLKYFVSARTTVITGAADEKGSK